MKETVMKNALQALVGLLLASSVGCTGLLVPKEDQLMPAARYSELETYMESQIKDLPSARTSKLWYLCYSYSRLKKYNKLFPCLDQFESNVEKGDATANMFDMSAVPPLLRTEALLELGEYKQAVEQAHRAYGVVLKKDLPRIMKIHALSALALAHALNGERKQAEEYARLLEDIGTHYPFTFLKTDKLNGLARTYMALGDFQKSLDFIREDESIAWFRSLAEAATIAVMAMPPSDSVFAYQQLPKAFILNKSLYETGRIQEAKTGYDQLLQQPRTQDNGDIYWMILFDRGKIAEAEGNRKEAIDFYRRALEVIERQRSTINTETSKIGFVGDKQQVYHRMIAALLAEGQPAIAFEFVERSKARALVDLLASKKDYAVSNADPQQVASLVQELDRLDVATRVQETTAAPESARLRSARDLQVKEKLRAVAPELASLVTVTQVTTADLQPLLQRDETLIEYYYQGEDLYAFVLNRDGVKAAKLKGANLVAETGQFRAALEDPQSRRFLEFSRSFYARLLKPIEPMITTRQLLIVSHGVLHYLPFSALHGGTDYVIDRYGIRHLPSASVMQYLKDRQRPKALGVLAFGNPDLGDPQYDLKFAQDEAVAIAKGFPQTKVLLRKDASKTAFKSFGPQFAYLHFATHGKFDPDVPLNSGLLLAGDAQNDGFLSLGELYSLRLNADLVTLSACETGLGKINNGDDVVGLARGFLYAGSNAIVASLWEVDDQATSLLMTEFYANIKKGNKREALRQAQLAVKKQFEHPFYWAAFQLTGRPE